MFLEGRDRLVVSPVNGEYVLQGRAVECSLDVVVRGCQFEFTASISCGGNKTYENSESLAVDVLHVSEINNNLRAPLQKISYSFSQSCAFVTKHDAAVAVKYEDVTTYLCL